MWGVWLGVLAVVTAGECGVGAIGGSPAQAGMPWKDAEKELGSPSILTICGGGNGSGVYYRTDWLGGSERWWIKYRKGRVSEFECSYTPFQHRPEWLRGALQPFTPSE